MRVAVLGGWRSEDRDDWGLVESQEQFCDACHQIGRALIERGHSLIVGTDAQHTADGNAALGAIQALEESGAVLVTREYSMAIAYSQPQNPRRAN